MQTTILFYFTVTLISLFQNVLLSVENADQVSLPKPKHMLSLGGGRCKKGRQPQGMLSDFFTAVMTLND